MLFLILSIEGSKYLKETRMTQMKNPGNEVRQKWNYGKQLLILAEALDIVRDELGEEATN